MKTLRFHDQVYSGLKEEERKLFADETIRQKLEELEQWVTEELDKEKGLSRSAKFLLDMVIIALDINL